MRKDETLLLKTAKTKIPSTLGVSLLVANKYWSDYKMKHKNFFRTMIAIRLSFVFLFIFSACSQNGGSSETIDTPTDINQSINMMSDEYQFVVNSNNTVTITKYTGEGRDIEIPSEINEKRVTAIGNTSKKIGAFQDCTTLVSVVIPEGVTEIQDNAFQSCSSLKTVTIPASITVIWHCAFDDCPNFKSVYFEGDAPQTGNYVFSYISPLTIYYNEGAHGWTNPWYGCPTETY
jgi:hypothetical protein